VSELATYPVLDETRADAGNTPYPVALFRSMERMEVNISMDNAEKLARAFGVELVELLSAEMANNFR